MKWRSLSLGTADLALGPEHPSAPRETLASTVVVRMGALSMGVDGDDIRV